MITKEDVFDFKIKETYKLSIGSHSYKIHIVAIIDEGLSFCPLIVYRYFGKYKQWWHYEIKSAYSLTGDIKRNKSMTPKEYYRSYQADDKLSDLSAELLREVMKYDPVHVLDFGCGTGKHLSPLNGAGIATIGIDISPMNCYKAIHKYDLPCIICSDETYLRNLCNIDVVFTCSVLDHIEAPYDIIEEFKRIANKAVILAETDTTGMGDHYFSHLYNAYGFTPTSFQYEGEDGAVYSIWKWERFPETVSVSSNSMTFTNQIPHRQ